MFTLYSGLYADLTPMQQEAIVAFVTHRYATDVLYIPDYLQEICHLPSGTPAYAQAYADKVANLAHALRRYTPQTHVVAIFAFWPDNTPVALATMRTTGGLNGTPLADSIGLSDSDLPLHTLFAGLTYPQTPTFDAQFSTEKDVYEVGRLAAVDPQQIEQLVQSGVISHAEAQSFLALAFDELVVATCQRHFRFTPDFAAFIFNVSPRLARQMQVRQDLVLLPLFANGVEPTAAALEPKGIYASHFQRWSSVLCQYVPDAVMQQGLTAAIRYLVDQPPKTWLDLKISLPYITLHDSLLTTAVARLEERLEKKRVYRLTQTGSFQTCSTIA